MVDKIYGIKNKVLEQIERGINEKGIERIDPQMVDVVKDLAEAEKSCWEADYYRSVVESMAGGSGYSNGTTSNQSAGWANQYGAGRSRRGYSQSMGYQEAMNAMRGYMHNADPVERERMRGEMRDLMDGKM